MARRLDSFIEPFELDRMPNNDETIEPFTKAEAEAAILSCVDMAYRLAYDHWEGHRAKGRLLDLENLQGEALLELTLTANLFNKNGKAKFSTVAYRRIIIALRRSSDGRGKPLIDIADPSVVDKSREVRTVTAEERSVNERQREIINALGEPRRTICKMRYLDGLEPDQIAAQVGITVERVLLHLRNSTKTIVRKLKEMQEISLFD